jgi:hypothetical protein
MRIRVDVTSTIGITRIVRLLCKYRREREKRGPWWCVVVSIFVCVGGGSFPGMAGVRPARFASGTGGCGFGRVRTGGRVLFLGPGNPAPVCLVLACDLRLTGSITCDSPLLWGTGTSAKSRGRSH